MNVQIISPKPLARATEGSSGYDLMAASAVKVPAGGRQAVPTGVYLSMPPNYEAQVRGRSGLAFKYGIVGVFGTIDSDYRGELVVLLVNTSLINYNVEVGDRIAQLVFQKVEHPVFEQVHTLPNTIRGSGGFGSSGR
jgi:dUTP pyrophosphatase